MIGGLIVAGLWLGGLVLRFYAWTHDDTWRPRPRPYYPLWAARAVLFAAAIGTGAVLL
ncbi:hypothetical protein [Sphingomonas koreensis]